jgi:hypothetical protein
MNKILKVLLIIFGIFLTFIVGFFVFLHFTFDGIFTGPSYDKQDLIDNYEKRKTEIIEVKEYINSKIPSDTYFSVEFENGELGIFHVKKNGIYESNWNLDIDSKKTDSLLTVINWTKNDLKILKNKLEKANCISASSGNPTTIGWQRSGMGKFSYSIFHQKLTDSLIKQYNDGCMDIYYKDNVVLNYGGGAIGPQCFPKYERKK